MRELDKLDRPFQTVVVTGRNEELRRDLAAQDRKHPTHILGYASNMHELMAVAALVITKPGGLTSSEALAMGKPLFILNPIPGQEAANSDFLLEHGAAAKANRVEDLPFRLEQILGSNRLNEMATAARALGRPAAGLAVCREVFQRLGTWRDRPASVKPNRQPAFSAPDNRCPWAPHPCRSPTPPPARPDCP